MSSVSVLALAALALRATCLLALSLAVLWVARRSSAALRRCVLLLGLSAALGLPLFALPFHGRPALHLRTEAVTARFVAEALSGPSASPDAAGVRARCQPRARNVSMTAGETRP